MRQPALGAGDQAAGHLCAQLPRQRAQYCLFVLRPWQGHVACRQFASGRVEAQGGQQGAWRYFAGCDQLFNLEQAYACSGIAGVCISHHRIGGAQVDADQIVRLPLCATHAYCCGVPRTSNSTFQRSAPSRETASSSSVPASVTRACSLTCTTSPAWRPSADKVAWISLNSCSSSGPQKSSKSPIWSLRRVDAAKKRKCTGSPTTRPNCWPGSSSSLPSSMPNGATHRAWIGGSMPGMAGMADSIAT